MIPRRAGVVTVSVACALAAASSHARPDDRDPSDLFRFDPNDTILQLPSEHFLIHFCVGGRNGVPAADADGSGTPDHVEAVAAIYEDVLRLYTESGFRAPVPDDDGVFDVYLVDFGGSADGSFVAETCAQAAAGGTACSGYIVQENDFAGFGYPSVAYANRLVASHEFFHAVQHAYDANQGAALAEGTAVWASEFFDASLGDVEGFGASYLAQTDNSIDFDGAGPADPFTYGTALFHQHRSDSLGVDAISSLWARVDDGSHWLDVFDEAEPSPFAEVFPAFALAMLEDHRDELHIEAEALPFSSTSFRSFAASFRTICAPAGSRSDVEATTTSTADEDVDAVVVRIVALTADGDFAADATTTLEAGPAVSIALPEGIDQVCAQVINTRVSGEGARPTLCLGDHSEVTACQAALREPTASDADQGDGERAHPPPSCASTRGTSSLPILAMPALAIARGCRRRR